jgi:hypothetical protein
MKLGDEEIVLIDRSNLIHNFIAQSHSFFHQSLFCLFHINFDKTSIIFVTANFSVLE